MQFNELLEKYRKEAFNTRDQGDRFERLMQAYLLTEPTYRGVLKKVWLWGEFPYRDQLGIQDTGIDLVAETADGEYWAVQVKFFLETGSIDKGMVDTFLSTSSKSFELEDGQEKNFVNRLFIYTAEKWSSTAEDTLKNQQIPVTRIGYGDLSVSEVDWEALEKGVHGEKARGAKKSPRAHQIEAIDKTHAHFKENERGKLIMACGTGKTYTSLQIAEKETDGKGLVLFLVPSIALLGQTLREWSNDAKDDITAVCICSDPKITKKTKKNDDTDSTSVIDLALPASTNPNYIAWQFVQIQKRKQKGELPGMVVVFSTYQSIERVHEAQKSLEARGLNNFSTFDLIICDEAHRTTGVSLAGDDESAFVKVHDNNFIRAKKRLYMTATPRLYSDDAKAKASLAEATLCSMDDKKLYGQEIYRIGFGEAVERNLLTDYKVLVLTLNEKDVPKAFQKSVAKGEFEVNTDDLTKLIGCVNALSKQVLGDNGLLQEQDAEPMKRAVAFCQSIAVSKKITKTYNEGMADYANQVPEEFGEKLVQVRSKHIDGSMSAPERDNLLAWLKAPTQGNECRTLTNVRCLSEGVDVPSLDAVMFLSARNSQVDVVQSVGRVMRRAPNKKYGYIIIPIVIPSDVPPELALADNDRYKVVWTVLNALRAHDDRFNATINKIELNKQKPDNILVGGIPWHEDDGGARDSDDRHSKERKQAQENLRKQLALQFEQLQGIVFAKMVEKVGDRRYWEQWASSVAEIAQKQVARIKLLLARDGGHRQTFEDFMAGLHQTINPSISEDDAIEMLSQHLITKPVFEALFEDYSFVANNPVSQAMQGILDVLEKEAIDDELDTLQRFYDSVRKRAEGIDNAEGEQRIIVELYDKFFKTAFPRLVDQLGIVYTPVEIVDFIIRSVDDISRKEFGKGLADEDVHILDPFTGTGTFITRLIQSGLIPKGKLPHKYGKEIHANEIVLLAYYIAAVNIEQAFAEMAEAKSYKPFEGMVFTDTFQLGEAKNEAGIFEAFSDNAARVERQRKAPLKVIIGNPPYSVGQESANDNAQNQKYEKLDGRIADTYAKRTDATNKNSLYDSYIKAFRWSSDRLDPKVGGVICFVSNGAWIDGNAADGFRKCLEEEFSSIYVFNLRGNQRTSGELSRKEGGKIFGSGSRTPISITLLVKNPKAKGQKATIHYHDIGDYLTREEKLGMVSHFGSMARMDWSILEPNEHGDWINQRDESFGEYIAVQQDKDNRNSFFVDKSRGVETARDDWNYNSSKMNLSQNIKSTLAFFNSTTDEYVRLKDKIKAEDFVDNDPTRIKWSSSLLAKVERGESYEFSQANLRVSVYRPFFKQYLYFGNPLIHRLGHFESYFPTPETENLVICVSGVGVTKEFTCIITNILPDLELIGKSQCFPLYYWEESKGDDLFSQGKEKGLVRKDGVSDWILKEAQGKYGTEVAKEDIFYFVYGFLHDPTYRATYSNDLKKMLPRLPLPDTAEAFWQYSQLGRDLADLHLNYESVPANTDTVVEGAEHGHFKVKKMRFGKTRDAEGKSVADKSVIQYNSAITLRNIPLEAYDYIVNGKSAIEWVMDRYQITTHKASGITNDPNDWCAEVGNERYILDLLLSVIEVSVRTVGLVRGIGENK